MGVLVGNLHQRREMMTDVVARVGLCHGARGQPFGKTILGTKVKGGRRPILTEEDGVEM